MTKREKQRSLTKEFLTWVKDIYPKGIYPEKIQVNAPPNLIKTLSEKGYKRMKES